MDSIDFLKIIFFKPITIVPQIKKTFYNKSIDSSIVNILQDNKIETENFCISE